MLLVEHDMHFIMGLCDRITVLNFGRKIAEGSPLEVREIPQVIEAYLGAKVAEKLKDARHMTGAYLEVRGLSLGYSRTDAVKAIDIDVPKGGVVTLIGANGAGKTTTLRGLSGLLKPRGGSIRFEGHEIAGLAAHRIARLGIIQVPEGRQVFPNMTIAENLADGRLSRARPGRRRAAPRRMVLERFPAPRRAAAAAGRASCRGASSRCWPWAAP